MAKFIVLYVGPASNPEDLSEEKRNEIMNAWGAWMGKVGDALVDVGQPTAEGVAVVDDGSEGPASLLNGYSILEAADIRAAKGLVADHPFLSDSDGKFKIEVFELLPVPM